MYTTYVNCTDKQFRLSLNHNAQVLVCSDVCQTGGRIFRLTKEQKESYESMTSFDHYALKTTLYSPVWGNVLVTYVRSPEPFEGGLPTTFSGVEGVAYTRVEVLSDSGQLLMLPKQDNGYSKFEYLLKVVKKLYCDNVYAFDPNEWKFLPRPRFSDYRLNPGLNAIRESRGGEIIGYDYMIDPRTVQDRQPQNKELMDVIYL